MNKSRHQCIIRLAAIALWLAGTGCATAPRDATEPAGSRDAAAQTPAETPAETSAAATDDTRRSKTLGDVVEDTFDLEEGSLDDPLPPEGPVDETADDPCLDEMDDQDSWLDKAQRGVSWTVCGSARWFDGFFGNRQREDEDLQQTYGRLGLFGYYDERDGFDPDFRFRAKFALPALERRARLLIGRGDERELIEERGTDDGTTLPTRLEDERDESWLVGVGFQGSDSLKRGFDTSIGVRLRFPPDPFVKLRYRENWDVAEATLFRWRQTAFWTERRGFGTTTDLDLDRLLSRRLLVRWSNSGTVAEDREGLDWYTALNLYQNLSNRRALTYRTYIYGETDAPEELKSYGFELRYRQRVLREWLFVDFLGSVSWPKYLEEESRDLNLGVGVGFEMYFGPVPDRELR